MFTEEASRKVKQQYLYDVLAAKDVQAATALYAYAQFLNRHPLRYEYFPLYLKVFEANNRYAIDAMLEGYENESFLDMVIIPNHYVVEKIFRLLGLHMSNSLYEKTVLVLCGFVRRVYMMVEDGYRIFQPTINDLNGLAKHLNEDEDQDFPGNRTILDILQYLSGLDNLNETDKQKLDIGRQANRIRGDFLDDKRKLLQAITSAVLKKAESVDFGIVPAQLQ
jgi:hypothetical protein